MSRNELFITLPCVALTVFVFCLCSFLNARKAKAVHTFQYIIVSCILWIGGALFMRIGLRPGAEFWFHISLLGVVSLPIAIYCFLFSTLEIKKEGLLITWGVLTAIGVIFNVVFGFVITPPERIVHEDGIVGYRYTAGAGVWVLLLIEIGMFIYVTYLAHKQIGKEFQLRYRLLPLLIGTISSFAGLILTLAREYRFPYDSLAGIIMALSVTYVLYKQYRFEWYQRLRIGMIYMVAIVFSFAPIILVKNHIAGLGWFPEELQMDFLIALTILMIWEVMTFVIAFSLAEHLMRRMRQSKLGQIRVFENETVSLFEEDELYDRIIEAVERLGVRGDVYVYSKKLDEYKFERTNQMQQELPQRELQEIVELLDSPKLMKHPEITLLKYDEEVKGFIYLKSMDEIKMNYIEEECFRQIGAYASVCLKNISIYQKVYQLSIHDELTGLYNRTYFKDFIEKYWDPDKTQSLIYMDLDDFKLFNELYGESTGDDILRWCGWNIRDVVGEVGATFRIGANEFVIFTRCADTKQLRKLVEDIQNRILREDENKPNVIQPITLSVGIVSYPDVKADANEQLKQAKKALFYAKRNGKNRIEVYKTGAMMDEPAYNDEKAYEQIAPTIYALTAAIDAKDSYTFEHSCHVSADAVVLANAIGLNSEEVRIVKEAGLLHDIGKIGVPEAILKKKGKLSDEEFAIMKTHVVNSTEMIHHLPNMEYVIPAVLAHHERYDGKGYPMGLKGEAIPLLGRILAVCDSFDAITSKRSYKDALSLEYAIAELERNKGTQFDPYLADVFIKLIQEGKIER